MPSVRLLDCALATYSYAITQFNPVAAATDVWQLSGAGGITTKVRWIEVGGTAAALRTQPVGLIKRSTATSGATNTTPTISKADSTDAAAKGVITQWTTLPGGGVGAAISTVDATTMALLIGGTSASLQDRAIFNYEALSLKPVTLNGAAEFLCVNFAVGTPVNTIATDKLDFEIWWTEQ